jgi:hypothetical protein
MISDRVEISLRFKMTSSLRKADYERLAEFAKNHSGTPIALSPASDFQHVSVSPITVAAEGSGLRIDAEVSFKEPIGFDVSDNLRLKNETRIDVKINRRNFKLSTTGSEPKDLERGLTMILEAIQHVVNNVCAIFGTQVRKVITLDGESLDIQVERLLMREELDKRGESPRPFGEIHATGPRDAKERAGKLIPLYKEHDKTYLYDAKRVYYLLPHSFVVRLLRCDATTLVRREEFDKRSADVLRDLVYRKYLKKRELSDGTVCYYGLAEKTQRYLKSRLEHKTPRR